jgi:gliding motility-associated-like protein
VAKPIGALCPTRHIVKITGGPEAVDFDFVKKDILCFEDKGGVRLFGFKGSSSVNYSYEVADTQGIVRVGTITQFQVKDTVDILGFDKGVYAIRLYQDQSATSGCATPITSDNKPFILTRPPSTLDTLAVYQNRIVNGIDRMTTYPDARTARMLIDIKESGEPSYQVKLELTDPVNSSQRWSIDWTDVPTVNARPEFQADTLYAGVYKLSIRDARGCVKSYDITIDANTAIWIPNVFTPNGDTSNDTFFIRNLPSGSKLTITNRWGNQVFSSDNYDGSWNGGAESDGVYYYRLLVGSQVYNGWVEIMRGSR